MSYLWNILYMTCSKGHISNGTLMNIIHDITDKDINVQLKIIIPSMDCKAQIANT